MRGSSSTAGRCCRRAPICSPGSRRSDVKAFAALFDDTRPPGDREDALLSRALDGADGSLRTGPLALAWRGDSAPSRSPLCFVDGRLYGGDQDGLRDVLARRGPDAVADLRGDFALL